MPLITLTDSDFNEYLGASVWSSTSSNDNSTDPDRDIGNIDANAIAKARLDCETFLTENEQDITTLLDSDHEIPDILLDFWFTRNDCGCDFSDAGYPLEMVDRLNVSAKQFGEVVLYIRDGVIRLTNGEDTV